MLTATIDKIPTARLRLYEAAKKAGVPSDTLKRFLSAGYVPQLKQLQFHAAARLADTDGEANDIGFGGARGPGKTHATFAQVALDDCQRVPGLKVLFLRKVAKSANEAIEDLRSSVLKFTPHTYKENKSTIVFPNKSRIILGHFQYEKDIDNYLGLEYDVIVIEEATQLSEAKINKIKTCNRSSKSGFRPRRYYTTNPGNIGHAWFKKKFIAPFRLGPEAEKKNKTKFIPATAKDNKKLNKDYIESVLEPLVGWEREAWLEGSWDIYAGQFFTNFNYELHTIKPDLIPRISTDIAEYWCALDYGTVHYTACYLFMRYDGVIYVLAEHAARQTAVETHAKEIKEMLGRFNLTLSNLSNFVAGSDVFAQRGAKNGETISDQYAEQHIYLTEANTDRINGAGKILKLLGDAERQIAPKIKISENCVRLLECLPSLEHDPNRPEDVKKVDMDDNGNGGDDFYDALRYGLMVNNSTGVYL